MMDNINSAVWWENYFKEGTWKKRGGHQQTNFFARILLENLDEKYVKKIREEGYSICDVGCACGEGAYNIKKCFPMSDVCGIDISRSAIECAKNSYRDIEFECRSIDEMQKKYDVCISSNVLEHFSNPEEQLKKICQYCNKYLIVMVPYQEKELDFSHEYRFSENDLQTVIKEQKYKFFPCYRKIIDTSKMEDGYWDGKQLLVIYEKKMNMMQVEKTKMPSKEVWDKVSEDYAIELAEDETRYAEELNQMFCRIGIKPPAKILELGSGSGHLSAYLAMKGYEVSLLDFSTGALEKSKQTFEKYNLNGTFIEGDLFDLCNISSDYDLVWNSGVMEHFSDENLLRIFEQIKSIMQSQFIFLVPNPDSISYLMMRYNLQGKGEWEYGQEYLRTNYLEVAKKVGLSGKVLGYAASSISVWHFESTFQNHENTKMYAAMVNDELMPRNESYLVAYVLEKTEADAEENEDNIDQSECGISKEQIFELSGKNFDLNKKINYFEREIQRYLEANKIYENQIIGLKNQIENLQKEIIADEEEKERYQLQIENQKEANENYQVQIENYKKANEKYQTQIEDYLNKIENNNKWVRQFNDVLKPQVSCSIAAIIGVLQARGFSRLIKVHAVLGALKRINMVGKLKLIVKLLLRCIGIKRPLNIDTYRMDYNIIADIRNVESALQTVTFLANNVQESTGARVSDNFKGNNAEESEKYEESIYAETPLISVLIPVYNHADFICEAIQGVQNQTYTNWELIILNDGSTDNLMEHLENFKGDPRIKIYTQDNQRLPNGLTNLHNLATGQFITWTSADNIMEVDMLKELSTALMKNPDAVMVYGDVAIIDDKGNYKLAGYREMNRDSQNPYIMRLPHCTEALTEEADNFINACFMYRAEPVRAIKGMYSADLEGLEDYDFWLRLQAFGRIVHIKNEKPLYKYRVHENTMSEDLLKNKLDEHIKRTQKMMLYTQKKVIFRDKNWRIFIDSKADGAVKLEQGLEKLHYDYKSSSEKCFSYVSKAELKETKKDSFAVTLENGFYTIYYKTSENSIEKRAKLYSGYDVSVLARKVRQTFIQGLFWEYPAKFVNMSVLGCHIDINCIDTEKTIEFLCNNPEILFSFAALPDCGNKEVEEKILSACDNAIFMGEREVGTQLYLYSSWNASFIPPIRQDIEYDMLPNIILSWSIGKWVLIESSNLEDEIYPLMSSYYYGEKLLGIPTVENLNSIEMMLDAYIYKFSTAGAVKELLQYMNGIAQDVLVERPDFKMKVKERKFPPVRVECKVSVPENLKKGYIALMVDSLDKGGLEQVVASLARKISKAGISIRVFCTQKGGEVARQLISEGYTVIDFAGDVDKFENYIKNDSPILVNTHYAKAMLNIVNKYKIPMVEVIHNMYVFQDDIALKRERELNKYFAKMIAVSSLVKEAYEKRVDPSASSKIEVIGNIAETGKMVGKSRNYIRSLLGIPMDSYVMINVSSIDSRKNQLGLIRAFEAFCNTITSNAYLILVGNVLSDFYNIQLEKAIDNTICKDHILKLDYHKEIGDLYAASDVFVMPSYFEGWSIAATEALYNGLPIIHSMCGSARELVNEGKNGIVIDNPAKDILELDNTQLMTKMNTADPDNTTALMEAMQEISQQKEVWHERRRKISARAIQQYNERNMLNGYLRVFSSVIE